MLDQTSQSQAEPTGLVHQITIQSNKQTSASPLTVCAAKKEHTTVFTKQEKNKDACGAVELTWWKGKLH